MNRLCCAVLSAFAVFALVDGKQEIVVDIPGTATIADAVVDMALISTHKIIECIEKILQYDDALESLLGPNGVIAAALIPLIGKEATKALLGQNTLIRMLVKSLNPLVNLALRVVLNFIKSVLLTLKDINLTKITDPLGFIGTMLTDLGAKAVLDGVGGLVAKLKVG